MGEGSRHWAKRGNHITVRLANSGRKCALLKVKNLPLQKLGRGEGRDSGDTTNEEGGGSQAQPLYPSPQIMSSYSYHYPECPQALFSNSPSPLSP